MRTILYLLSLMVACACVDENSYAGDDGTDSETVYDTDTDTCTDYCEHGEDTDGNYYWCELQEDSMCINFLRSCNRLWGVGQIGLAAPGDTTAIPDLGCLTSVDNDISITYSTSLTDVSALYQLDHIGGRIMISSNQVLDTCELIEHLIDIGVREDQMCISAGVGDCNSHFDGCSSWN